jgi:hypothetical protein
LFSALSSAAQPAAFFLEGLTIVSAVGTAILVGVFTFLYFAERSVKNRQQ